MASTTVVKLPNESSVDVLLYDIRYRNEEEDELIKQPSNGNEMPVHFYKELEGKIKIMSGASDKAFKWIFYKLNDEGDKIIEHKFPTDTDILISTWYENFEMVAAFPKHDRQYHYKFSLFQKEIGSNEWVGCNCTYEFQTVSVGTITETKEAKNIHFKYRKNIWNSKKRKQDIGNKNVNKKAKHGNNNNLEDMIEAVSEKEDEAMKSKLRAMTIFDISRSSKEFCDRLEAHRKMFLYQNENAVMCSVVVVDGETFPATLRLELGERKPICFPPPCSFYQLKRFINNQASWQALYDPSVWILAQQAEGCKATVMTNIVQVSDYPTYYKMEEVVGSFYTMTACAQEHMLHYAKAAKWDSEFIYKYYNQYIRVYGSGYELFLAALENGHMEYVKGLLCAAREAGVDISVMESELAKTFFLACEQSKKEKVKSIICAARGAGMDVAAMVSSFYEWKGDRWTPLMIAARREHSTIIEILLQCNADTATTDNTRWNALHCAAHNNKTTTTTVELLLNNMKLEDINHKDTFGRTPLDDCYKYNDSSIKQQLIKLIREKGGKRAFECRETYDWDVLVDIYKNEFPKGTPFVCACEEGRVEDVKAMIRGARAAGRNVTAMVSELGTNSSNYCYTPLIAAADNEHSTIIEILLQCNADTATTTNYGSNALYYAAQYNTTTTITKKLLDNMQLEDINHKDKDGYTPLDRCYDCNDSSIKQQLIDLIRRYGGKRKSELSDGN